MLVFEPGTVVKVPFPNTDRDTRQRRPALVVSSPKLQTNHGLVWVVMITSAANRGWPGDVEIVNLRLAGLPAASVIRPAKIVTLEGRDAELLGHVPAPVFKKVKKYLADTLNGKSAG